MQRQRGTVRAVAALSVLLAVLGLSAQPAHAATSPVGSLDTVNTWTPSGARVQGWAVDTDAVGTALTVHVYVDGVATVATVANTYRPDVEGVFPGYGVNHGYDVQVPVSPGQHQICTYGISVGGGDNSLLGCRQVSVQINRNPIGAFDDAQGMAPGGVRLSGWAIDPDSPDPVAMHVYLDGAPVLAVLADQPRPDVGNVLPEFGPDHGLDVLIPDVTEGTHTVCLYAINIGAGTSNTDLGCRTVYRNPNPIGQLDDVIKQPDGNFRAWGWAIDADTDDPVFVGLMVDGTFVGVMNANTSRPDVAAAFPGFSADHGFEFNNIAIGPGYHSVCLFAAQQGSGPEAVSLGCRGLIV